MSIYFLIESPDVKWRAVKKSVPQKNGAFYIPPVSRLNKKRLEILKSRLIKENALYFSSSEAAETLFACPKESMRAFFYSSLASSLKKLSHLLGFSSVMLFDADEDAALYFLTLFPALYLSGENAEEISDGLLFANGAAVPVAENAVKNSAAVFFKNPAPFPGPSFHPSFPPGERTKLGAGSFLYRPGGRYAFLSERIGRPLTCGEAARLSHSDKSAVFDISLQKSYI